MQTKSSSDLNSLFLASTTKWMNPQPPRSHLLSSNEKLMAYFKDFSYNKNRTTKIYKILLFYRFKIAIVYNSWYLFPLFKRLKIFEVLVNLQFVKRWISELRIWIFKLQKSKCPITFLKILIRALHLWIKNSIFIVWIWFLIPDNIESISNHILKTSGKRSSKRSSPVASIVKLFQSKGQI